MSFYSDQTGRKVAVPSRPQRIVSLVPSQTELLYDLGLEREVKGITGYCVRPGAWLSEKTVIGGTKDINIRKVRELKPDLIIGNKEENVREQVEELALDFPVWLSDVRTFADALDMIRHIGDICHKANQAEMILQAIQSELKGLPVLNQVKCLYFIWKNPYMVAGNDTFISGILDLAGFRNISPGGERYPALDLAEIANLAPDVILLGSEPYAFNTGDLHLLAHHSPQTLVKIVDGEMFSWYGSRILKTIRYLKTLLPELQLVL